MKVYVVTIEDQGHLVLGLDCSSCYDVESVHRSFEDALLHLEKKYEPLIQLCMNSDLISDHLYKDDIKGRYQYFDYENLHVYEITIFEKELA